MWWTSLLNFLTGGIADKVLDAYKAKLADGQSTDKLAADLASREIDARRQIALAELSSWFTALPRVTIEMIVAVYLAKVIVWDKVLGLGSTDAITGSVGGWVDIIIVGMFGTTVANRVAGALLRR